MEETWKQIPGFDKYEISTLGRARHIRHLRILAYTYPGNGYPQVGLSRNGKKTGSTSKCVHQLMAITFMRPLFRGEEINHRDTDRSNPALENLEIKANKKEHMKLHRKRKWHLCSCGKELPPYRKNCSDECRHEALWEKRVCKRCGTIFEMRKSYIKSRMNDPKYKNIGVYCSNQCRFSDTRSREMDQEYLNRVRKFSPEQVSLVRKLFATIDNASEIARMMGVSRSIIRGIKMGATYRSLASPALEAVSQFPTQTEAL